MNYNKFNNIFTNKYLLGFNVRKIIKINNYIYISKRSVGDKYTEGIKQIFNGNGVNGNHPIINQTKKLYDEQWSYTKHVREIEDRWRKDENRQANFFFDRKRYINENLPLFRDNKEYKQMIENDKFALDKIQEYYLKKTHENLEVKKKLNEKIIKDFPEQSEKIVSLLDQKYKYLRGDFTRLPNVETPSDFIDDLPIDYNPFDDMWGGD
jgi:hypothetical protein